MVYLRTSLEVSLFLVAGFLSCDKKNLAWEHERRTDHGFHGQKFESTITWLHFLGLK